jgi:hypothetical protein
MVPSPSLHFLTLVVRRVRRPVRCRHPSEILFTARVIRDSYNITPHLTLLTAIMTDPKFYFKPEKGVRLLDL